MAPEAVRLDGQYQPATRPVGGIPTIDALDRRTRPYRRYEAIRDAVLSDMGGEENTSEVQRQLVAKFSTLALQLKSMEAAAIEGNEINLDLFGRCAGHLRRIAEALGMKRVARDVTPSLTEYLAARTPEKDEDEAPAEATAE